MQPDNTDVERATHLVEAVIPSVGSNKSLVRAAAELFCAHRIAAIHATVAELRRVTPAAPSAEQSPDAIPLGCQVIDRVTGRQGLVAATRTYLHGSTQLLIDSGEAEVWIEQRRVEPVGR